MSESSKCTKEKILLEYIPMALTGIGIIVCAIIFKQVFIKVLPLCFSLLIIRGQWKIVGDHGRLGKLSVKSHSWV